MGQIKAPSIEALDTKMGFQLVRKAELAFNQAATILNYAIYARTHEASIRVIQHWLNRAVKMSEVIDLAYESKKPAFSVSLMNKVCFYFADDSNYEKLLNRLKQVTNNLLLSHSWIEYHVSCQADSSVYVTIKKTSPRTRSKVEKFAENSELFNRSQEVLVSPTRVSCKALNSNNDRSIDHMMDKITVAISEGSPIILEDFISHYCAKLFPKIKKASDEKSPEYKAVSQIKVRDPRYKKTVTAEAKRQLKYENLSVE